MFLFMFLLLPLILAAYCFYKKDKKLIPVIFLGIIAAVLVCGFKAFFLYSHRIIPFSFGKNVIYLLVRQTLLPILLAYGIFFLWSKDSLSYKIEAFFPLISSFYMLYLPYTIISSSDNIYTSFPLFVKPILFAVMISAISIFLHNIEKALEVKNIPFIIIWSVLVIFGIIAPSLIESMYILNYKYILVLVFSFVYMIVMPFCGYLGKRIKL